MATIWGWKGWMVQVEMNNSRSHLPFSWQCIDPSRSSTIFPSRLKKSVCWRRCEVVESAYVPKKGSHSEPRSGVWSWKLIFFIIILFKIMNIMIKVEKLFNFEMLFERWLVAKRPSTSSMLIFPNPDVFAVGCHNMTGVGPNQWATTRVSDISFAFETSP